MATKYNIEIKFGAKWIPVDSMNRHTDALHYIKMNSGETYPMRIVRIVKTVVFEEKK